MPKYILSALAALALMSMPSLAQVAQGKKNVPEAQPAFANQTRAPELRDSPNLKVEIITRGLRNPWGVEVLPDGRYLVTERPGALKLITLGKRPETVRGSPKVLAERQGGLLDVALAEDFATSKRIYLTYAKPMGGGTSATAAATAILEENPPRLTGLTDIFVQSPPSPNPMHYGSRIVLKGPHAFITAGEHSSRPERVLAQDLRTTYGKVVRVTLDGGIPSNNPFRGQAGALGEVYSYGHRNPQGAALHPRTGDLWTLEHGPKGGDELNRIQAVANYGWPVVSDGENYNGSPVNRGQTSATGVTEPRYYWDPVIAPGGFTFYQGQKFDWNGDILAGSLNPGGLVRLKLDGDKVVGEARYLGELGRVRDVDVDRDGAILLLVDARSGGLVRVTPEG